MTLMLEGRDRAYIIAEAGTCYASPNPEKRHLRALGYVLAAHRERADAVKFQMFAGPIEEDMFCWMDGDEDRVQRWRESAMSFDDWALVKDCANDLGIDLLASAFQHSTVEWCNKLELAATKVASRAAQNYPYDKAAGPFLISTGMEYPRQQRNAIYLECEANYPSTATWSGDYSGFSDHSGTPWRAIDAIVCGCKLIEVHFYIDPMDAGPDLPASLTLDRLGFVCEARDAFAQIRKDAA